MGYEDVSAVLRRYMLGELREFQKPARYQEWKPPYRKCNFFFLLQRLNCSRKVVMQVFTRCVNSAVEADAVISFWFVVHANDMIPR